MFLLFCPNRVGQILQPKILVGIQVYCVGRVFLAEQKQSINNACHLWMDEAPWSYKRVGGWIGYGWDWISPGRGRKAGMQNAVESSVVQRVMIQQTSLARCNTVHHAGVLVGERRRKLLSYDSSYWDSSQHRVIWCEAICTAVERGDVAG